MVQFEQLVLDEAPDAMVVTTPSGEVLYWNRGAERIFGFSRDEAVGRALSDLIVPPDQVEYELRARAALERGVATYEAVRRSKDGALLNIDATCRLIEARAGRPALILACKKDVTELRARRDAHLVGARFGQLLDGLPDAILIVNPNGRIVLANAQAERLFGHGRGELRGQPADRLLTERHRGGLVLPHGHDATAALELAGLRVDGREFPIEVGRRLLDLGQGTMTVSSIRDISARRQVADAAGEGDARPRGAPQPRDSFLATMSHELRTPLNAIIGFTGTLLMRLPGPLTADQEKQLSTVQSSARHLLSLINDLLDLARIESGRFELQHEPVDLRAVLEEVAATLRPQAEEKGLRLELGPADGDWRVATDRRAVARILAHLAGSAIRYTDSGGIALGLHRRDDPLLPIELRVVDTGGGMPEDKRELLLGAFGRIDGSPSGRHDGTGLGLHLSQRLATMLHGRIELQAGNGRAPGSAFSLLLPEQ